MALVLVAGCGGDDSTGPEQNGGSTFTATIDGSTTFTGNLSITGTKNGGTFAFVAEQNAGQGTTRKIILTVADVTGPGTYTWTAPTTSSVGLFYETTGPVSKVWTTGLPGGTGSVTITEITTATVSGTFTFTAAPSTGATTNKVISNGQFYVIFAQ